MNTQPASRPTLSWIIMTWCIIFLAGWFTWYWSTIGLLAFFWAVGIAVHYVVLINAAFVWSAILMVILYAWLRSIGVHRNTRRNP